MLISYTDFEDRCVRFTIKSDGNMAVSNENEPVYTIATFGNGAIIGSNAVVTKDIPPYAIVGGNPAKDTELNLTAYCWLSKMTVPIIKPKYKISSNSWDNSPTSRSLFTSAPLMVSSWSFWSRLMIS